MRQTGGIAAVVWAPEQDRTQQFAERLGADLYCIHYLQFQRPLLAPIKYIPQSLKTLQVLFRQRPKLVYVTNPPIFAAVTVWLYCWLTGGQFVMDTHSPALYSRRWGWSRPLQRLMAKRALVNITDQERFRQLFESWGAEALILEKPLKSVATRDAPALDGAFQIAVVNIFAVDEPLEPILEAARRLPEVHFHILGDTALAEQALLASAPGNVTFTGWLMQDAYWERLLNSHAVMTLTTYPHSLVAGGTDGLAAGRPLLLSRQPALTEHFVRGAVFVDNTADGIVQGVEDVQHRYDELARDVIAFREQMREHWQANFSQLQALVDATLAEDWADRRPAPN